VPMRRGVQVGVQGACSFRWASPTNCLTKCISQKLLQGAMSSSHVNMRKPRWSSDIPKWESKTKFEAWPNLSFLDS